MDEGARGFALGRDQKEGLVLRSSDLFFSSSCRFYDPFLWNSLSLTGNSCRIPQRDFSSGVRALGITLVR